MHAASTLGCHPLGAGHLLRRRSGSAFAAGRDALGSRVPFTDPAGR